MSNIPRLLVPQEGQTLGGKKNPAPPDLRAGLPEVAKDGSGPRRAHSH